jgi:MFS transporter, UMF1 family
MKSDFLASGFTKPVIGWILYDIASSGYIAMIPSFAYAVFYRQIVCGGGAGCDGKWAIWVSLSLLISGGLAPWLGAIADIGALRHRLFIFTTLLCGVSTLALVSVQPGAILWGGLVFLSAQTGYLLATGLYDAYLPSLVSPRETGRLSGLGWGLGYLGGIACFLLFWLVQSGHRFDKSIEYDIAFAITGFWLLFLSVPALIWLPHQSRFSKVALDRLIRKSYGQVWQTLQYLRQNREMAKFLLGYYFLSSAIITLNNFVAIYFSTQFGLTLSQILPLNLLFNLISIPATIAFGLVDSRWSKSNILRLLLGIWAVILAIMIFGTHPLTPLALTILPALVVGSTQSLCRGWFAQMVQTNQATELFGFNALAGRMAAVSGPLLFGGISAVTGNQRLAVVAIAIFLGLGGMMLSQVRLHHDPSF